MPNNPGVIISCCIAEIVFRVALKTRVPEVSRKIPGRKAGIKIQTHVFHRLQRNGSQTGAPVWYGGLLCGMGSCVMNWSELRMPQNELWYGCKKCCRKSRKNPGIFPEDTRKRNLRQPSGCLTRLPGHVGGHASAQPFLLRVLVGTMVRKRGFPQTCAGRWKSKVPRRLASTCWGMLWGMLWAALGHALGGSGLG